MRVLDLSAIYPNERADFEGRSVAALDRALVAQGLSVTTLVLRPWLPLSVARRRTRLQHLAVPPQRFSDEGVSVAFLRYLHLPRLSFLPDSSRTRWNSRSAAWRASAASPRSRRRFEVIHAQGIYLAPAAARLAQAWKIPFTATLRDDLGHLKESPARTAIFGEVLCRAAALFAIGPAQMRDLRELIPRKRHSRLHLAPNGVDIGQIRAMADSFAAAERRASGPYSIVSVGNLYRWKGVHENLAALRRLLDRGNTNWTYTVVGDGPYRCELEELAGALGLSEKVDFVGQVEHSEALQRIWESDVFCLPSWMESFGNVFAEAAVCGVPAIGCLGLGPELIIRDGETGFLVPPKNEEALANALARLIEDPGLARRMGKAASEHISQFSWDHTATTYAQILRQIVSAPSGASENSL